MALVGDILVAVREKGPDPASFLAAPSVTSIVAASSGGTLATGTYYAIVSATNQWGESLGASESSGTAVTGPTGKLTFTVVLPPGATGFRTYISTAPAAEQGFIQFTTSPGVITTLTTLTAGSPPVNPTAVIPDSDGTFVNAFTLYRWLNDGLRKAGRLGGGIPDTTGVQAISGTAMYRLAGKWIRFTNGWFDGWPIMFGKKAGNFLHGTVSAISGLITIEQVVGGQTTFQLWPQPSRTGATTTLNGAITATASTLTGVNAASFLGLGFCQVDDEIMEYSGNSANVMGGLLRGLGGTTAAAHVTASTVTELNIRLAGYRQPNEYGPGDAAKTLDVPTGWEEPLLDYVLAQYRKAEQDLQSAQALEASFEKTIMTIQKASRKHSGPRQIGGSVLEVFPGTTYGGVIIP